MFTALKAIISNSQIWIASGVFSHHPTILPKSFSKRLNNSVYETRTQVSFFLKLPLDLSKHPTAYHSEWLHPLSGSANGYNFRHFHAIYLGIYVYVCRYLPTCRYGVHVCVHICVHTICQNFKLSNCLIAAVDTAQSVLHCWSLFGIHSFSTGWLDWPWHSQMMVILHLLWVGQSAMLWCSSPEQCGDGHSAWPPPVPCESPQAVAFHLLLLVPEIPLSPGNAEKNHSSQQKQWRHQQRTIDMKNLPANCQNNTTCQSGF